MKKLSSLAIIVACCMMVGCADEAYTINSGGGGKSGCAGKDCSKNDQKENPGKPAEAESQDGRTPAPEASANDPVTCPENTDYRTDAENCGSCGNHCEGGQCYNGRCVCDEGYLDCDGNGSCETFASECECVPGQRMDCYDGPEGTEGVGVCRKGYNECLVDSYGVYWGYDCVGQVLPAFLASEYVCDAAYPLRDNDCNGVADSLQDEDGDGYPVCKNGQLFDCCDNEDMCLTSRPDLVHAGVPSDCRGNGIDDNCNGLVDEGQIICGEEKNCEGDDCETEVCKFDYGDCDTGLVWNHANDDSAALLLARSMDICMNASSDPNKGALIEYSVHRSGSPLSVDREQINVLEGMKNKAGNTLIPPRIGRSFAMLSTGIAQDAEHMDVLADRQFSVGWEEPPALYLSKHGNRLESHAMCKAGGAPKIHDSVVLHLKLQAPLTAKGFSFDFRFFSREYPFFVCSQYNDFFLTILTDESGNPIVSEDGNISFDEKGNAVSVNNAFFTTCASPSCYDGGAFGFLMGACPGNYEQGCVGNRCGECGSMDELYAYYPMPYVGFGSGNNENDRGGGTAWLTTSAPIEGGQIFNLDFYIWDTGDRVFDSTVILDNFQWLCDAKLNTGYAPPIENPVN